MLIISQVNEISIFALKKIMQLKRANYFQFKYIYFPQKCYMEFFYFAFNFVTPKEMKLQL